MMSNFSSVDTPLVGSSSIKILGLTAIAIAISSNLRTPPGRTRVNLSRYAVNPKRSRDSSANWRIFFPYPGIIDSVFVKRLSLWADRETIP